MQATVHTATESWSHWCSATVIVSHDLELEMSRLLKPGQSLWPRNKEKQFLIHTVYIIM
jgi:hypothetical protein